MKKIFLSMLRTVSVLFLLALFAGVSALQAQTVQNELVSKNLSIVRSALSNSTNLMLQGRLIMPDSAVMFEHPSNKKMAVVSWPEYDEQGNAMVIETYDYVTQDKGRIEYKYGYFPSYHGIYEYSRPLEYTVYAWEAGAYIATAQYKFQYDSNGKMTYHEVYLEGDPVLSCQVVTEVDGFNRIISEDYIYYPGIMGLKWNYEYGANGKIKKWTTEAYAMIIGITESVMVDYVYYNSNGLCTERILESKQMGALVSRTKEKMFYENENKIVRNETWEDAGFTNEFTMVDYGIFYYGGSGSGITEAEQGLNISLYPNPTTGELRISSFEFRVTNVEVFDIYGKKLNSKFNPEFNSGQNSEFVTDISLLSSGIYFVKIKTEQGTVTKKVIKN